MATTAYSLRSVEPARPLGGRLRAAVRPLLAAALVALLGLVAAVATLALQALLLDPPAALLPATTPPVAAPLGAPATGAIARPDGALGDRAALAVVLLAGGGGVARVVAVRRDARAAPLAGADRLRG